MFRNNNSFSRCFISYKPLGKSNLLHGVDAHDLQNFPDRLRLVQPALGDGHEQIGAVRRPDLHTHAVKVGAAESSQTQVLFDPAKKQFDGLATAINLRDEQSIQLELIGEEDQRVAGLRVDVTNPAELVGIVPLTNEGVEFDGLSEAQPGGLVDGATLRHVETGGRV